MDNNELHALYESKLIKVTTPSFEEIRKAAKSLLHDCFKESETNKLYDELKRGVDIIDREELLWQYLLSYGLMHQAKINLALGTIPKLAGVVKDGYSVIDWGCGQGLATICLLDYLRNEGIETRPDRVILVEPSELAIRNAQFHVSLYDIESTRLVPRCLDDVAAEEIETESPVTIHLFSNILDIKDIDLKKLARVIADGAGGEHYFVCVSPLIWGRYKRLDHFRDYFVDVEDIAAGEWPDYAYSAGSGTASEETRHCTVKLLVFKYTVDQSSIVQVKYYPPVQFFAAYQLDSLAALEPRVVTNDPPLWSAFEVAAPFDLGGHVYDDIHPALAVLSNIVSRGLPTKCSPLVEEAFAAYGEQPMPDRLGSIEYEGELSDDNLIRFAQVRTPIGIARVQKAVLEAIICGKLTLNVKTWRVLVRERDVPCAALAFEDLSQAFTHLTSMTKDYSDLAMPEVELTVIAPEQWADSPLHLGTKVRTEASKDLKSKRYDLVIDVSTSTPLDVETLGFSEFRAKNDCYFAIGSSERIRSARQIYTSDIITYRPLGQTDRFGNFEEDPEMAEHLTYFLNLLFRKRSFRPGQMPILNRALQNKNVIGLLPTGGGKSLTYQLAALLQPGVTIVIDPLRSLMQDQYEGLVSAGIDACAFINSTISEEQKRAAEKRMESSELQFVFLTPERLCIYEFRQRLQTMHEMNVYFSYGVIDEVHCVSEWGHDFRFSYLHLGRNMYNYVHTKDHHKRLTLFGLTATASFDVLSDVERELSGAGAYPLDANTIVRYENTDRLELQYKVDRVPIEFSESYYPDLGDGLPRARFVFGKQANQCANQCKSDYLAAHIREIPAEIGELQSEASLERIRQRFAERQNIQDDEAQKTVFSEELVSDVPADMLEKHESYPQGGIVFCPHKKSTGVSVEANRDALAGIVADIGTFVGGSDDDDSDKESFGNLSRFKGDEQPLMIATKAFGMGIDKPNVRFTVNMNYPSSLESFVQEAGRAGRDRRISLATILVGDYKLARVIPSCPIGSWPLPRIRNNWYDKGDLDRILAHFGIELPDEYIEIATPLDDWVKPSCSIDRKTFESNRCSQECAGFAECALKLLPAQLRGWTKYKDLESELSNMGVPVPRTDLSYMNADYGNNMYFYNNNFLGERIEKKALYKLFCQTPTEVFIGDTAQRKQTQTVPNLLDAVLSLAEDQELVAFVKYSKQKKDGGRSYNSAQKAIYRMCCFGFVDDFTQDYRNREFRLVMRRKADGNYYAGLKQFLMRYYAEDRAKELVADVPNYRGDNEVQKCLGYLTEFIYGKIAVKRKRALDDVRAFCAMGLGSDKDWKETNEDLKDFIYYYFNSKYARDEYVTDSGEPYSLTADTDWGKESPADVAIKYLRVVDDELVGPGGTPIDNVKHLQGAVRLIRRSLTDTNPCLALLNYFCLTQLGTNGSEALEQELRDDYKAGMTEFARRFESQEKFWRFKRKFDDMVEAAPHRYDIAEIEPLQDEISAQVHLESLREIRYAYVGL